MKIGQVFQTLQMLLRTICFILCENMATLIGILSLLGTFLQKDELVILLLGNRDEKKEAVHHIVKIAFLFILVSFLFVIAIFLVAYNSREVPLLKGEAGSEVHDILIENKIAASIEFYWSESDAACFLKIGEDGLPDPDMEYDMDINTLNDIIVTSHTPEASKIIPKDGSTLKVYCKRKNPDKQNPDYEPVISLENYRTFINDGPYETTVKLPVGLFEKADSAPKSCPLWNPGTCTYYSGQEQGLYIWISETANTAQLTDAQIAAEAEQYYMSAFNESHAVDEDIDSLSIVTGFDESKEEVVYALVSVQEKWILTLFISFPYKGIISEEEYKKSASGQFTDYEEYYSWMEEDYKIKSYMVTAIYSECSFSQAKNPLVAYNEYSVVWHIPVRKAA